MKKLVISLCLVLSLFAFTSCTNKVSYVSISSKMLPYEKFVFNVSKTVSNKTDLTGTAEYIVSEETYQPTGEPAYKISAVITNDYTVDDKKYINTTNILSYVSSDTSKLLTPIYTEKEYKPTGPNTKPWKLTSKFDNTSKLCTVKADFMINNNPETEEKTIPLKNVYLDNETLALTIRSIDLKLGYNGLLNVIVTQYGRSEPIKVNIADTMEKKSSAYGTFDCYKVTLSANTIFAGSINSTICYITQDKVVIRVEQGPYIYDLKEYTTQK